VTHDERPGGSDGCATKFVGMSAFITRSISRDSDEAYDSLERELRDIEAQFPI